MGLTLDSSATDCWDNPISAEQGCIYLERDINSRLKRYAEDKSSTDVWIWYECVGTDKYLIYIGYASSDSKDEDSFKTEILYAYIAAVRNDVSGENYKPVKCRDIASYLADSRVSEYLLREGGAISKCYNVITAPSNQILQDTTIFTDEDFSSV